MLFLYIFQKAENMLLSNSSAISQHFFVAKIIFPAILGVGHSHPCAAQQFLFFILKNAAVGLWIK